MADKRTVAKRDAQVRVVKELLEKSEAITKDESLSRNPHKEVGAYVKSILNKKSSLNLLNEEIQNTVEDDSLIAETERATQLDLEVDIVLEILEDYLRKCNLKETEGNQTIVVDELNIPSRQKQNKVRLPKLDVKKFNGDPVDWLEFKDTFDVAIHKNEDLTPVEKFTYLKGYLVGEAQRAVEGLKLTQVNYEQAIEVLEERFGCRQVIISKHMDALLNLDRVKNSYQVKELRNLYDKITINIRGLLSYEVDTKQFSPMLSSIIMQKLPNDIKLELTKNLNKGEYSVDEIVKLLRVEIEARETCQISNRVHGGNRDRDQDEKQAVLKGFTTDSFFTGSNSKVVICAFCKEGHYSDRCTNVTDIDARKEIVRTRKLCYKCLRSDHIRENCRYTRNCFVCRSRNHNTAICEKKGGEKRKDHNLLVDAKVSVLLQTTSAEIYDTKEERGMGVKVLFDSGSQRTYVSQRVVDELKVKPFDSHDMVIKTFGNLSNKSTKTNEYRLCLKGIDGSNFYIKAYGVPVICTPLTGQRVHDVKQQFPFLQKLKFNNVKCSEEIDVLIGADYFWSFITGEIIRCGNGGLVALNTKLGHVLSGPFNNYQEDMSSAVNLTHALKAAVEFNEEKILSDQISKFWSLDSVGILEKESSVYENFESSISFKDGRYEVSLPFKESHPVLSDNHYFSKQRLKSLTNKLHKQPELMNQYNEVISQQAKQGVIEFVERPEEVEVGEVTYLPHRAVVSEEKSTKVRVVYDCSAKTNGPSLNDCLYTGPCLTPLLYDMILRFRVSNIGITADIEKAYLQISVAPEFRDFLRFHWYDDVFMDNPKVVTYRFARVIFGATCSQYILNSVIKKHVLQYLDQDPEFVKAMLEGFYVDDLAGGKLTVKDGIEFYKKAKVRFAAANFNLRKWRTNNPKLREIINEMEGEVNQNVMGEKVLGITWQETSDTLEIDVKQYLPDMEKFIFTKRNVLKVIASFYDPMGFIQPIIVQLKILFQQICERKVDWDQELPEDLKLKSLSVFQGITKVKKLRTERCYCFYDVNNPFIRVELCGFADSSLVAYGCVIYFKYVMLNGDIKVVLVTSKSRVAPIKTKQTIPRLELTAALILARLVNAVVTGLNYHVDISKIVYYSDSKIVLAWINAVDKVFKTFVQNRVAEIRSNLNAENWHYCASRDNPADILTRVRADNLENPMWLRGRDPNEMIFPKVLKNCC